MSQNSSKNRVIPKMPEQFLTKSPFEDSTVSTANEMQPLPHAGTCEADVAELNEALRFITTAFLDLGFGMSTTQQGVAKRTIQQRVMAVREELGAQAFVIHGWRYTAAVHLAEAGASDSEIQAVTGHKTLEMVKKYRNQANQRKLSQSAQARRTRT